MSVQIFSPEGKYLDKLVSLSLLTTLPTSLKTSLTHTLEAHSMSQWVLKEISTYLRGAVFVYESSKKYLRTISLGSRESPDGIALSSDGKLIYIADTNNFCVLVNSTDNKSSHLLTNESGGSPGNSRDPCRVTVGTPDGHIFVSDSQAALVQVYTPSGQHVRRITTDGNNWVVLSPQLISSSPVQRNTVFKSSQGKLIRKIEKAGGVLLKKPLGVTVHWASGMVYFADTFNHRIVGFPIISVKGL